jgi:hypothetical protein
VSIFFRIPVLVTINFEAALNPDILPLVEVYYNKDGVWQNDGISVLAVSTNYVFFSTSHFTQFSIVEQIQSASLVIIDTIDTYAAPNPVNLNKSDLYFVYDLADHTKATIKIYVCDFSGTLLWKTEEDVVGSTGTIRWDGRTSYGRILANGPYVAYVVMTDGGWKKVKRIPIAVLK